MYLPPHVIFDHIMRDECTLEDWGAMACVNREWNMAAVLFKRRVLVGAVIRVFGMGWGESEDLAAVPLKALVERYTFAMAVIRKARVDIGVPDTGLGWFMGLNVEANVEANVEEAADALCCNGILGMLRPIGIPAFFARILPDTLIRPNMYYAAVSSLLNGNLVLSDDSVLYDMAAYWPWHRRLEKIWPTLLVLGWTQLALREYDALIHCNNKLLWGEIVFAFFARSARALIWYEEEVYNHAMKDNAIDMIRQMIEMFEESCECQSECRSECRSECQSECRSECRSECQSECRSKYDEIIERYHDLLLLLSG